MTEGSVALASRTEILLAYLCDHVRRRATQIDLDPDLTSLTLVVKFNGRTGHPYRILFRPETELE